MTLVRGRRDLTEDAGAHAAVERRAGHGATGAQRGHVRADRG